MCVPTLLTLVLWAALSMQCADSHMSVFYFVNKNLTWREAQQYCRQHYHDLATVSSAEDHLRMPRPRGHTHAVWIGLYDDPTDLSQWMWSATGSRGFFEDWRTDEPDYYHDGQQCALLYNQYSWITTPCSKRIRALCYSGSNPKVFHYTNDEMTWFKALDYCRTHHTDLALIESEEENTLAVSGSTTWLVWIGMYKIPWRWSDKSSVSYTNWKSLNGKSFFEQQTLCAAENADHTWDVYKCAEQRTFYCQKQAGQTMRRFVKIKFSGHSLEDSMIKQQILEKIQKKFQEAGFTTVNIMWKTAPKKQVEYKPALCNM